MTFSSLIGLLLLITTTGGLLCSGQYNYVGSHTSGARHGYDVANSDSNEGFGEHEGMEDRPRVNLGIRVRIPAFKVELPRFNLPRITVSAKIRQPDGPRVIQLPGIDLDTSTKTGGNNGNGIEVGFGGAHEINGQGMVGGDHRMRGGGNKYYSASQPAPVKMYQQPSRSYYDNNDYHHKPAQLAKPSPSYTVLNHQKTTTAYYQRPQTPTYNSFGEETPAYGHHTGQPLKHINQLSYQYKH